MIDINELENRYKRYKIKSYIPYVTILVSLIVIFTIIFFIINSNSEPIRAIQESKTFVEKKEVLVEQTKNIKNETKIPVAQKPKKVLINDKNITTRKTEPKKTLEILKPLEHDKVIISPSLNFMRKMQNNAITYYDNETSFKQRASEDAVLPQDESDEEQEIEPKQTITIVKKSAESVPNTITITRQDNYKDIENVIKRFKKHNNPALSLFVAKKYYALGEYEKAYNYALITNDINNEIEASWLLFAKSLVKLNKKERAIKTLKDYINHSHSDSAKILLDDIEDGAFK